MLMNWKMFMVIYGFKCVKKLIRWEKEKKVLDIYREHLCTHECVFTVIFHNLAFTQCLSTQFVYIRFDSNEVGK